MVTFTQWTKNQVERNDAVGYFAKYWNDVTPGKISSIAGVRKHLETIEHDRTAHGKPDDMAEPAWERAKVALGAAKSGLELAVAEYTRMRAVENAQAHGLALASPELPSGPPQPADPVQVQPGVAYGPYPAQPANPLAELRASGVPGTQPPDGVTLAGSGADLRITRDMSTDERLARIEHRLAVLAESHKAQHDMLRLVYAELVVKEPDWDGLWAIASRATEEMDRG